MYKKRTVAYVCLMVCLSVLLAACSSSQAAPASSAAPSSAAPAASSAAPEPAAWKPTKTITLICPFNPGSTGDIFSRPFAEIMSKYAGVQVVVDNQGGGSGSIGTVAMLSAPADGYTFSYHSNTGALNTAAGQAPFGVDDVQPFVNIGSDYHTMTVLASDSRFQSLDDIIKYAHDNPGQLKLGGAQVMGNNHLFALLFMRDFDIDAAYIPYDDGAAATLGILGGNFDVMFSTNSTCAPYVESGDLREMAYTLSTVDPEKEARGVPTFASKGSKGLDGYISFKGMFISPKCPDEVKAWYDDIGNKVCHDPEWIKFLEVQQQADTYMNMADFTAYYKQYVAEATELFKDAVK